MKPSGMRRGVLLSTIVLAASCGKFTHESVHAQDSGGVVEPAQTSVTPACDGAPDLDEDGLGFFCDELVELTALPAWQDVEVGTLTIGGSVLIISPPCRAGEGECLSRASPLIAHGRERAALYPGVWNSLRASHKIQALGLDGLAWFSDEEDYVSVSPNGEVATEVTQFAEASFAGKRRSVGGAAVAAAHVAAGILVTHSAYGASSFELYNSSGDRVDLTSQLSPHLTLLD